MRKVFVLMLVGLLFVLCGVAAAFAAPTREETVIIGTTGDPSTIDPHATNAMWSNNITINLFDPLVRKVFDQAGKFSLVPSLATKWEQEDDITWIITLREGVQFHNGDPFTADDVVFSIQQYKDSTTGGAGFVQPIASALALDTFKVQIKTHAPYAILVLDMADIYISSKKYFEKVGEEGVNKHPIGTGPYKFVEWIKEDHITMDANEDYWGPKPKIKRAIMRPLKNDATRVAALLSGEVDLIYNVPVRDIDRVSGGANTEVKAIPGPDVMHINIDVTRQQTPGYKHGKNPFLDRRVREAFAIAIDRDSIIKNVYGGHAYPTGQLPIPGAYGYVEDIKPYPYNPEKARQLLKEAGYPDGFEFVWDVPQQRYFNDGPCSQAIAGFLAKVGIKAELNMIPSNQYLSYINPGDKTTAFYGASGTGKGDIGYWYNRMFYTRDKKEGAGGSNRTHYSNPEVDKLLDEADSTADVNVRKAKLEEVTRILYQDYAIIPIYQYEEPYGMVKGLDFTPRVDAFIFDVQTMQKK